MFRRRYPEAREYTWYSPNGRNGFRLDQAFINRGLETRLQSVAYAWGKSNDNDRREALSDHAAILLDFD